MEFRVVEQNGVRVAFIESDEPVIVDAQSALDLLASGWYHHDLNRVAVLKRQIAEDFFRLATGFAGDVLQKVVNYHAKIAIIGDFSAYQSKPLQDFIRECNRGNDVFFVPDEQAALEKLTQAK